MDLQRWTASIEAELVEFADGSVGLKKPEGVTVTVPLERLSEADRQFLTTLKKTAPATSGMCEPFLTKYCLECHNQRKSQGWLQRRDLWRRDAKRKERADGRSRKSPPKAD